MNGCSSGLGSSHGDTRASSNGLLSEGAGVTLTEILDNGSLHPELDEIQRDEPNDVLFGNEINNTIPTHRGETTYPNPYDTNPTAGDTMNVGEAPVGISSDNGGDQLSNAEGTHEGERRTLHEEESVRTSDEDEGLRDDGNLEVHDHVKLGIVVVGSG